MRRTRIVFVVNGGPGSAMALRAEAFAKRLSNYDCGIIYRSGGKLRATQRMLSGIIAANPDVCYVLDCAASGVIAAGIYRQWMGVPYILDTGDAIVELGRVLGRGRLRIAATRALENYAFRAAASVVVRGSFHRELLAERGSESTFIPDGVAFDQFGSATTARRQKDAPLTIGLIGSSIWIPQRQTCYGWELVELIRLLHKRIAIRGVLIGDGSGIEVLKRRCEEYGISHLIEFAGRISYSALPAWLCRFDICLSTQTDDVIGRVRTTGKLPLYLAAGRFVLASRVGEAANILPEEMLVDFRGEIDPAYPAKLAERLESLIDRGTDFSHRPECVDLARQHFDYAELALRVGSVIDEVLGRRRRINPVACLHS